MAKGSNGREQSGPSWTDNITYIAELEADHGVSLYLHLWPYTASRDCKRYLVRIDAVPRGSSFKAKHICTHSEYWPNGRQFTLAACVYRVLLEMSARLEEMRNAR